MIFANHNTWITLSLLSICGSHFPRMIFFISGTSGATSIGKLGASSVCTLYQSVFTYLIDFSLEEENVLHKSTLQSLDNIITNDGYKNTHQLLRVAETKRIKWLL